MVVVPILSHAEFGRNDHREEAPYFTLPWFLHQIICKRKKDVEIAKKRSQLPIAQERQRLVEMIRNNKVIIIIKEYDYHIFEGSHRKRRNWLR